MKSNLRDDQCKKGSRGSTRRNHQIASAEHARDNTHKLLSLSSILVCILLELEPLHQRDLASAIQKH